MNDLDYSKLLLETIPRSMRGIRTELRQIAGDEFTAPQYRLLARISRETSSNQELADWMGVSAPTMTKMIDKLERRGLVQRRSAPEAADRRQIAVRITPKGAEKTKRIRRAVQQVFARRISTLKTSEKRALASGLEILRELFG